LGEIFGKSHAEVSEIVRFVVEVNENEQVMGDRENKFARRL
jgi:hypothetical protein